ncbi:TIGR03792 family protein [Microcoleus sp. FACHB-53]|nr:TIGR03792 family protein [Microcoleus sp. FACHB-53]MBD2128691.1 TIGR03792 family protein [Microcoleus sp. FACHB-1]
MVIEWLKLRVSPELREKFIQKDAEIWTSMLATYPGFLGKEVWINPETPTEVIIVIRWASREAWESVPSERLKEVEKQFTQEFGEQQEIIEAAEYQVRKFPLTSS